MPIQFYRMKKCCCWILFYLPFYLFSQTVNDRLAKAINLLEADIQFKHAAIGMYVVETKTAKIIFEKNAEMGLVLASCQKLITSAAAFGLLGNNYRFKTELGYDGTIADGILNGNLFIRGYGDPTLGSWRWPDTKAQVIMKNSTDAVLLKGIKKINGNIASFTGNWESNSTPGGWVWEDIGNYYGAGASAINWRENQYDLMLKAGNAIGDAVSITGMKPILKDVELSSELTTAAKGSGDNAYIYLAPNSTHGLVSGTIPVGENNFVIAGAMPAPDKQLINELADALNEKNISLVSNQQGSISSLKTFLPDDSKILLHIQSPPLDSINYWFLKKSINLYGEAFVKAIAFEKDKFGSLEKGIELIKDFCSKNGIEKSAIHILDGSGLSPANRVTTKALVTVLQYAKQQSWFASFYNALPQMNGIKMKDGYIGGVRSYTGFIQSKNGATYSFSFIINNFDGSAATVREKMWKVLDVLK